jgi:hypothetical protein
MASSGRRGKPSSVYSWLVLEGENMSKRDLQATVTLEELLVSSLATADALAKLLIEKGIITEQEFQTKLMTERATYQAMLSRKPAN